MNIVFASNNQNKVREVKKILESNNSINISSLSDINVNIDVIEDRETFQENAIKKAKETYDLIKLPVIAEDSGLCVDALDGRPGVYSHRYYGNGLNGNLKLLNELDGVPILNRTAYYVAVMCYYDGETMICVEGKLHGKIGHEEKGTNGFAYDSIFVLDEYNKTVAELTDEEKSKISHRGIALEKMKKLLIT